MARRFRVTVNGQAYEVEVEETGRPDTVSAATTVPETAAAKALPVVAPAPIARPEPKPVVVAQAAAPAAKPRSATPSPRPSGPAAPAGKGVVTAPIPGVISQVKVQAGQAVKTREVLMLLEAMKMQNEILAQYAGVVKEVYVSNGSTVNTGDKLVAIDPE